VLPLIKDIIVSHFYQLSSVYQCV